MSPPQLILSALTWTGSGEPTTLTVRGDANVGEYAEAGPHHLQMSGQVWVVELQGRGQTHLVEYIPSTAIAFNYSRKAYIGVPPGDPTCQILGENMPPQVRICLPGRRPWPQRLQTSDWRLSGPPFKFDETDWADEDPMADIDGLTFSPDLPGQVNTGHGLTLECLGWHADWVTALLERQDLDLRRPLGATTRLVFNDKATWAVEVHLQALAVVQANLDDHEFAEAIQSRGISEYTVRATILRVFVTPQELERLEAQPEEL
ncbi:hypothetical protein C8R46DRAFT_1131432 [Mycena filopes]|nr:hypothetical protein C8R46DRAFT_1131432 [Mycena filopes]